MSEELGGAKAPSVGMGALQAEMMAQLRRLNAASTPEEVEREVCRARAVADLGGAIVDNMNTMLRAAKIQDEFVDARSRLPRALLS